MNDKELYRELSALTKKKEEWRGKIPYVGSLLNAGANNDSHSLKITAKVLWLLGEMGLQYPEETAPYVEKISLFLDSHEDLLRERALNALGRIGRARFETVKPYWESMFTLAKDENPRIRLAFIWASENIATNTPEAYESHLPLFAELLHDNDEKVRMEAPEMFRVMGKRRPQWVTPYLEDLKLLSENDPNPVVRIHCVGALRWI
jgi:HEAT repeat protein